ncbi:hypothetical protein IscW_ISCW002361 [Ixodes scapularis]|uniref:Uncharacterized protein n=1 Tax=Ixodes scapularis TaxID=6945 RepID=B7PBD1_IXOSC|nr:hypothetical protein IscW_ISCW002361 [Ixodes scapularis]|eukprot:XP_002407948.1 hypothetical protein IscW_ISCW002361 [Ixodes scapularis]
MPPLGRLVPLASHSARTSRASSQVANKGQCARRCVPRRDVATQPQVVGACLDCQASISIPSTTTALRRTAFEEAVFGALCRHSSTTQGCAGCVLWPQTPRRPESPSSPS